MSNVLENFKSFCQNGNNYFITASMEDHFQILLLTLFKFIFWNSQTSGI